jgi:fumarate hydratase class II
MSKTRLEKDTLGEIVVPLNRYWGGQTQRALENFSQMPPQMPTEVIRAFGLQKRACATVNLELGYLSEDMAQAIIQAAQEIADGKLDEHFPLSIWQSGSGTQTHMNVNEVIANRANEILGAPLGLKKPVHPNDHVNWGQSSNDSFPTVMHMATVEVLERAFLPPLHNLHETLTELSAKHEDTIKVGRTHLQDATPISLGAEFGAFAHQTGIVVDAIEALKPQLFQLAQGGTAVGTGLHTHPTFKECVAKEISHLTGYPFRPHPNSFAALSAHDPLLQLSGYLAQGATVLIKLGGDLRFLACGTSAGIGELYLPANEPGSSIMPGKVNPTQIEALLMTSTHVLGQHQVILGAGASGQLQLNVMKPLIIATLLHMLYTLGDSIDSFTKRGLRGIQVNNKTTKQNLEASLMLVTALTPYIGYDQAAYVAQEAYARGISLCEVGVALNIFSLEEFHTWVNPKHMAFPHKTVEADKKKNI